MTPTAPGSAVAAPPGVVAVMPGSVGIAGIAPGGVAHGAASLPDVGAVLQSLGLPPLPALPPLPPLPGLPPLPVLDLSALLKPLTDLLGAFGTADVAAAADLGKIFNGLSSLLDLTVSGTTSALRAVDKVWTGTAATSAATKMGRTATESGMVAAQGSGMSIDIGAAAGIVAAGLAALQAVIAKTVGLVGAALPFILTPPGQAAALAAISAGMAEGTAVVAATKAQLLAPTAKMVTNGAPVPISGAPAAGAVGAFGLAATALEALAVPLKTATGVLGSTLAAAARTTTEAAKKGQLTGTMPTSGKPGARDQGTAHRCCGDKCCAGDVRTGAVGPGARPGTPGVPGRGLGVAGLGSGGTGVGGSGAGGVAGPREVSARYSVRAPVLGGTAPAAVVGTGAPEPAAVMTPGAGVAPMTGAAAMGGAHAVGRVMGGPPVALRSSDVLADCDQMLAPAVFGDDTDPSGPGPQDLDAGASEGAAAARLAALREELLS